MRASPALKRIGVGLAALLLLSVLGGVFWFRRALRVHQEIVDDLATLELGTDRKSVRKMLRDGPRAVHHDDRGGEEWRFDTLSIAASSPECVFDRSGRLAAVRDDKEHTRSGVPTEVPTPTLESDALQVSSRWLQALVDSQTDELARLSALPYAQAGPAMTECAGVAATDAAQRALQRCVADNKQLFLEKLGYAFPAHVGLKEVAASDLASELRAAVDADCGRVVSGFVNGDGITFEFALCVSADHAAARVTAFVLRAELVE